MPEFVKLSNEERKLFFSTLKEKIGISWEKFYPKYKVSRPAFFFYLMGRLDIPKLLFDKWKNIAQTSIRSAIILNKDKYCEKQIPLMTLDEQLAEIIGVLNGDGHISKINYEVCVIGNAKETEYLAYLKNLFEKKLSLKFNILYGKGTFKLRVYSVKLARLLNDKYALPKGKKKGNLAIPNQIKKSRKLLLCYFRGLFDTDGTFYLRRKNEPVIEISSADKNYLIEIRTALASLGYAAGIGEHRIFIYNRKEIDRFFKEIKPANTKHLKKYKSYQNLSVGGLTV